MLQNTGRDQPVVEAEQMFTLVEHIAAVGLRHRSEKPKDSEAGA